MSVINLDPLVCLKRARTDIERGNCEYNVTDYLDTIEAALLELQAIKEANPNEALKYLENMIDTLLEENKNKIEVSKANGYDCELLEGRRKELESYKQALIKAQEQEIDITRYKVTVDSLKSYNTLLKDIKNEQENALKELFENHIELIIEKDKCYFKIKNSKGKEKSFTSYTMLDFWKEVLK